MKVAIQQMPAKLSVLRAQCASAPMLHRVQARALTHR
jgi:hypothetical protein